MDEENSMEKMNILGEYKDLKEVRPTPK